MLLGKRLNDSVRIHALNGETNRAQIEVSLVDLPTNLLYDLPAGATKLCRLFVIFQRNTAFTIDVRAEVIIVVFEGLPVLSILEHSHLLGREVIGRRRLLRIQRCLAR